MVRIRVGTQPEKLISPSSWKALIDSYPYFPSAHIIVDVLYVDVFVFH
jgi:hypothetical protein